MSNEVMVSLAMPGIYNTHTWDSRGSMVEFWPGAVASEEDFLDPAPDIYRQTFGQYDAGTSADFFSLYSYLHGYPLDGRKVIVCASYSSLESYEYNDLGRWLAPDYPTDFETNGIGASRIESFFDVLSSGILTGHTENILPFVRFPEGYGNLGYACYSDLIRNSFPELSPEVLTGVSDKEWRKKWLDIDIAFNGSWLYGYAPFHVLNGVMPFYPHRDNGFTPSDIWGRMIFGCTVGSGQPYYFPVFFIGDDPYQVGDYPYTFVAEQSGATGRAYGFDDVRDRLYAVIDNGVNLILGELITCSNGAMCTVQGTSRVADKDGDRGDLVVNAGSYGPGLEFYCWAVSESSNGPCCAAIMANLLERNPDWNFFDARAAMRQAGWEYRNNSGLRTDKNGFGLIDQNLAETFTTEDIELFGPLSVRINLLGDPAVAINWYDFDNVRFKNTAIALFDSEPDPGAALGDASKVWRVKAGRTEKGWNVGRFGLSRLPVGEYWFGFYSEDEFGNHSILQANEIHHVTITVDSVDPGLSAVRYSVTRGENKSVDVGARSRSVTYSRELSSVSHRGVK